MHFAEILRLKSRQQNSKNFNAIALIFRHPSMPSISLKFLLFCCLDFDPKISTKYIYSVYHLFYFYLSCRMVQDINKCWISFAYIKLNELSELQEK